MKLLSLLVLGGLFLSVPVSAQNAHVQFSLTAEEIHGAALIVQTENAKAQREHNAAQAQAAVAHETAQAALPQNARTPFVPAPFTPLNRRDALERWFKRALQAAAAERDSLRLQVAGERVRRLNFAQRKAALDAVEAEVQSRTP